MKENDTRYVLINKFNIISDGYYNFRDFLNEKYANDETIE